MRAFVAFTCVFVTFIAARPLAAHLNADVQSQKQEEAGADPTKGSKDVDRVLAYPLERVLRAAKEALTVYGCDVKKEKPDYLECTRDRHIGVLVGSGGEKVTVQLTPKDGGTRVQIKTGKGFVGRVGKKNWSTPIFIEMTTTLGRS